MSIETKFSVTRHALATSKPFHELIGELERRAPVYIHMYRSSTTWPDGWWPWPIQS